MKKWCLAGWLWMGLWVLCPVQAGIPVVLPEQVTVEPGVYAGQTILLPDVFLRGPSQKERQIGGRPYYLLQLQQAGYVWIPGERWAAFRGLQSGRVYFFLTMVDQAGGRVQLLVTECFELQVADDGRAAWVKALPDDVPPPKPSVQAELPAPAGDGGGGALIWQAGGPVLHAWEEVTLFERPMDVFNPDELLRQALTADEIPPAYYEWRARQPVAVTAADPEPDDAARAPKPPLAPVAVPTASSRMPIPKAARVPAERAPIKREAPAAQDAIGW